MKKKPKYKEITFKENLEAWGKKLLSEGIDRVLVKTLVESMKYHFSHERQKREEGLKEIERVIKLSEQYEYRGSITPQKAKEQTLALIKRVVSKLKNPVKEETRIIKVYGVLVKNKGAVLYVGLFETEKKARESWKALGFGHIAVLFEYNLQSGKGELLEGSNILPGDVSFFRKLEIVKELKIR